MSTLVMYKSIPNKTNKRFAHLSLNNEILRAQLLYFYKDTESYQVKLGLVGSDRKKRFGSKFSSFTDRR